MKSELLFTILLYVQRITKNPASLPGRFYAMQSGNSQDSITCAYLLVGFSPGHSGLCSLALGPILML